MRALISAVLGLFLASFVLAAPAFAQDKVLKNISPAELATLLQGANLTTRIVNGPSGEPLVMANQGNLKFIVRGVECTRGSAPRCTKLQFRASFGLDEHPSPTWMNEFNKTWVFGKAYVTPDGVARVEYPVNLTNGVTENNLAHNLVVWVSVLEAFVEHLSTGEIAPLT